MGRVMSRRSVSAAHCDALFASLLQPSQEPGAQQVRQAAAAAARRFGERGCAGRVAQEFGEHPEAAAARMRWARRAIARAFASRPRLVICDEITSSLDVSVQAAVVELLVELQRRNGTAYLFITHDLNLVRQIAHRIAVLRRGQLVETIDVEELARSGPRHAYTRALIDAVPSPREPTP